MVNFAPLAPSAIWMRDFLHGFSSGLSEEDAIIEANKKLPSSKEFGRFILFDNKASIHILSVAIEGGSRQLRNTYKIGNLMLSDHGDWRKVHLGAIEAYLGRTPFYRHIEQNIRNVYEDGRLNSLKNFNSAIFNVLKSFLIGSLEPASFEIFNEKEVLKQRGIEISKRINREESVLQALAHHGKESLLGLVVLE